jgi:hypothetical protein
MKADIILSRLVAPEVDLDEMLDDKGDTFRARVKELFFEPAGRNTEMWVRGLEELGPSLDLVDVDGYDLNLVPVRERTAAWLETVAAIVAGCYQQAFVEVMARDVLANGAERVRVQEGINADRAELRAAAKIGVSKNDIKLERERRALARASTTESGEALQ